MSISINTAPSSAPTSIVQPTISVATGPALDWISSNVLSSTDASRYPDLKTCLTESNGDIHTLSATTKIHARNGRFFALIATNPAGTIVGSVTVTIAQETQGVLRRIINSIFVPGADAAQSRQLGVRLVNDIVRRSEQGPVVTASLWGMSMEGDMLSRGVLFDCGLEEVLPPRKGVDGVMVSGWQRQ